MIPAAVFVDPGYKAGVAVVGETQMHLYQVNATEGWPGRVHLARMVGARCCIMLRTYSTAA